MSKEITKKFVENNGFICNKCGKIIIDGHKHKNEEDLCDQCKIADLEAKLAESEKTIEELKGERLKFYTDDVRQTQVINGVHFDIEQLLVFSEYVEHEKWVISNKDKEIAQHKQQLVEQDKELAEKEKEIEKLKSLVDAIDKYRQYDKDVENLVLFNPDNCYSNGHKLIIKTDKIDYAVEQLERVKERYSRGTTMWGSDKTEDVWRAFKKGWWLNNGECKQLRQTIDNQIKQLKEKDNG